MEPVESSVVAPSENVSENVSKEKARLLAVIERYKKSNPVKYQSKREELEKKLATL